MDIRIIKLGKYNINKIWIAKNLATEDGYNAPDYCIPNENDVVPNTYILNILHSYKYNKRTSSQLDSILKCICRYLILLPVFIFLIIVSPPAQADNGSMSTALAAYQERNFELAAVELKPFVVRRNLLAIHLTGLLYLGDKEGIHANHQYAAAMFKDAAKENFAASMYQLGKLYKECKGVEKNTRKGNEFIRKANAAGYPDGNKNIAKRASANRSKNIWIVIDSLDQARSNKHLHLTNKNVHKSNILTKHNPSTTTKTSHTLKSARMNKGNNKSVQYFSQLGAYFEKHRAIKVLNELNYTLKNIEFIIKERRKNGKKLYIVRSQSVSDPTTAATICLHNISKNINTAQFKNLKNLIVKCSVMDTNGQTQRMIDLHAPNLHAPR